MFRQMLKSKIHRAAVTDMELNYEGSVACDPAHETSASHQLFPQPGTPTP